MALAARCLLTTVFAAAGAALPWPRPAAPAQRADPGSAAMSAAMCAALIAMIWVSEPATVTWLQAALFGSAGLWCGLASLSRSRRARRPGRAGLHNVLMAGAMIWMLTAMPAENGMPLAGPAHGAMAPMPQAATPPPVLVVSVLVAVCCAAASIPWLAQAIGPGPRLRHPAAAGQAAMSAGMAAMLFATL